MYRERKYKGLSIEKICRRYGFTRQGYYKSVKMSGKAEEETALIVELAREIRKTLPRAGVRKLYNELRGIFKENGLRVGRDKLFGIMRQAGMLIESRPAYKVTTDSNHPFRVYRNLTEGFVPTGIDQLWVSDITYIRLGKGFCYLSLVTDAYSRCIRGYHISDTLELEGCLKALKMALKGLPEKHNLIHHSDRGVQYCSHAYTGMLRKHNIRISMADRGNCYQNALAERVNGILKGEFYLNLTFGSLQEAKRVCKQAIWLYNNYRPHLSLDYKKPAEVHYGKAIDGFSSRLQGIVQAGTRQGYSKRAATGSRTNQSPPLTEPGLYDDRSAMRRKPEKVMKSYV